MSVERKYAMTKLAAGDWICPSNDGRWLYRFLQYEEDGSAESGGVPVVGLFWSVARRPIRDGEVVDLEELRFNPDLWEWRDEWLPTRAAAIARMMEEAP